VLAAILDWIDERDTVIAIDGSLYKYHPNIDGYMRPCIRSLLKDDKKFDLILAEDGSGKGAGLVASIAQHL
jgi:hexokinase